MHGNNGISAEQYRSAMRHYPAGVTVVTLRGAAGPVGFTATSFASLSLDPPLVSFNIAHTSSSIDAVRAADSLVIHFLGEHQHHIGQRFSRTAEHRFTDQTLWTWLDTGEPVLHGTPIWLRVGIDKLLDLGDHALVIARVVRIHHDTDAPAVAPLVYVDGHYARPNRIT